MTSQREITEVTVGGHVHLQHEGREIDIEPAKAVVPNESTPTLTMMSPKTVERIAMSRDMEDVPNNKLLAVAGDNSCAAPQYWSKSFVSLVNVKFSDPLI